MERALEFVNYRNLGLDKPQRIVLNYSLEKGKIGGLITVIGPNNSGKSNVLDGLKNFKSGKFDKRDVTMLELDEKFQNPTLKIVARDGDDFFEYGYDLKGTKISEFHCKQTKLPKTNKEDLLAYSKALEEIILTRIHNAGSRASSYLKKITDFQQNIKETKSIELLAKQFDSIFKSIQQFILINWGYNIEEHLSGTALETSKYSKINSSGDETLAAFKNQYGFNLIPIIYRYEQRPVSSSELTIHPDDIGGSNFYKAVLKAINYDSKTIMNAYEKFRQTGAKGILDKVSKEINKKMSEINNRFNKLYYCENGKYEFEIELESQGIFFKISKNGEPLVINLQSTGFRWFFDFYFNFLLTNNLQMGDVVVSDEFATCLHPQGQQELRKFIKEFGQKNDITFVIATQSPFLADVDNFDELRVVSADKYAHISNSFTTVNHNDPDSLKPIKESFTISNHVLYDYDTEVVFVEGITDYNYLTMFKNLLGYEKIAFLPIEGLGKTKAEMEKTRNTLISIRKNHGLLLTDGDGAGKEMANVCKGTALETLALTDVDSSFVEIEHLFTEADRKKHNIHLTNKKVSHSSIIKNFSTLKSFTAETVNNFKKLFEAVINR